jgi:protein-disulfide isomerase
MDRKKALYLAFLVFMAIAGVSVAGKAAMEDKAAPRAAAAGDLIDVKTALVPRTLGDPKAPVKLEEYASLSCSHCAVFSKETFEEIKKEYIDTGKVYYTYIDFPTTGPAVKASLVSHCLPPEHYFQFIKFLFETQDKWAFSEDYEVSLRRDSKLLGMSDEAFDACVNNAQLKAGLSEQAEQAHKSYNIDSTPTFVLSNGQVLKGAKPFAEFKKILDPLVDGKGTKAQ